MRYVYAVLLLALSASGCSEASATTPDALTIELSELRSEVSALTSRLEAVETKLANVKPPTLVEESSGPSARAATANCPADTYVVSGGCHCLGTNQSVKQSSPSGCASGQCFGWDCLCSDLEARAYALCASSN